MQHKSHLFIILAIKEQISNGNIQDKNKHQEPNLNIRLLIFLYFHKPFCVIFLRISILGLQTVKKTLLFLMNYFIVILEGVSTTILYITSTKNFIKFIIQLFHFRIQQSQFFLNFSLFLFPDYFLVVLYTLFFDFWLNYFFWRFLWNFRFLQWLNLSF